MIALRLATRQWLSRALRPILCSLAIAAAVALIVGIGAGMDSLLERLRKTQEEIVGYTDGTIRRIETGQQYRMPEGLITYLKKEFAEIGAVGGRIEAFVRVTPSGKEEHLNYEVIGYRKNLEESLHPRTFVTGDYPADGDDDGLIIDELVAKELAVKVGDRVILDGMIGKPHKMHITGIVHRVAITTGTKPVIMAPIESFARDIGLEKPAYNVLELQLVGRPEGKVQEKLVKKIGDKLGEEYKVMPIQARKNSLAKTSEHMDFLIVALSVISGLSATIIIATTLSVGVQERIRQFGQLRCIGASRFQLVTILAAEALMLAVLGIALGLVIGYFGSYAIISNMAWQFPSFVCRPGSLLMGVIIGAAATLVGAAIPAWRISRVTPMQAVAMAGKPTRKRGVFLAAIIGVWLLILQGLMWIIPPADEREFRFWSYFFVGIPFIFAGYCLLAPAVLLMLQRVGAFVLGKLLGVKPALLRQSWSQTPWRAGAMIAALMIGVVMYASIRLRTEGISSNWNFPTVFPDVIMLSGNGAPNDEVVKTLSAVDGVKNVTGIGIGLAKMEKRIFGTGRVLNSQATRFAAIDVDSWTKMVELEFVQGDPAKAMERLKKGRAILVSREFLIARGIGLGDKISFLSKKEGSVEFEIAGVCKSAGIDMLRVYYDMQGSFEEEAVGTIIGTLEDGEKYFNVKVVNVALVNLDLKGRSSEEAIKALKDRVNGKDALKRTGSGLLLENNNQLSAFAANPTDLLSWQAASVIDIKNFVSEIIGRTVRVLSTIALAAMCIASLGVANMVIASMHARKYEFGILRAIGTGRGQLLRMVLAEVSVVALVAGLLGTLASLHFTWMGTRIDRMLIGFSTPLITWESAPRMALHVGIAIFVTLALSWLAALVPAARTAYRPQRELLAQGRT